MKMGSYKKGNLVLGREIDYYKFYELAFKYTQLSKYK
jgi:hypothetical protein